MSESESGNGVVFWRWVAAVLSSILIGVSAYVIVDVRQDVDSLNVKLEAYQVNSGAIHQSQALQIQSNKQKFDEIIRRLERIEKAVDKPAGN